ncbi:MAG: hypothetical protein ACREL5_08775 [Gemmatimonadales bacterium]
MRSHLAALIGAGFVAACSSSPSSTDGTGPISFSNDPCSPSGTLQLDVAHSAIIDCSGGGDVLTLAGNGASYVVAAQFATNLTANLPVSYTLQTGSIAASELSSQRVAALRAAARAGGAGAAGMEAMRPRTLQRTFEARLFSRAATDLQTGKLNLSAARARAHSAALVGPPPPLGSTRAFHVATTLTGANFTTTTAQLDYIGNNILLYVDTGAPTNGFTPTQLANYGQLFDQRLDSIDVVNFGEPSDIDQNGRVIMLLSQVVNGITPAATCQTQGYIAGFFDPEDFNGPSDANSNQGEIFYSVVPDPSGTFSCSHTVADVDLDIPGTFLHELQHLINFSQHAVVHSGAPLSSWLDEGMSIVAEELGSIYWEQKCPAPACRQSPSQLFPDSSQGFIQGFFFNSYAYALLPDTASLTLHNDSELGFPWRGGDWLLVRYIADHYPGALAQLETGPSDGVQAIIAVAGGSFPATFGNFGLALYTDSLPGLPRATAPLADRFVTRNMRQLWNRAYVTAGPSTSFPLSMPLQLVPITSSSATWSMNPGTMSFWRLDTPANESTVSIRFATPGGAAFSSALRPQLVVFRLPSGQ